MELRRLRRLRGSGCCAHQAGEEAAQDGVRETGKAGDVREELGRGLYCQEGKVLRDTVQ